MQIKTTYEFVVQNAPAEGPEEAIEPTILQSVSGTNVNQLILWNSGLTLHEVVDVTIERQSVSPEVPSEVSNFPAETPKASSGPLVHDDDNQDQN